MYMVVACCCKPHFRPGYERGDRGSPHLSSPPPSVQERRGLFYFWLMWEKRVGTYVERVFFLGSWGLGVERGGHTACFYYGKLGRGREEVGFFYETCTKREDSVWRRRRVLLNVPPKKRLDFLPCPNLPNWRLELEAVSFLPEGLIFSSLLFSSPFLFAGKRRAYFTFPEFFLQNSFSFAKRSASEIPSSSFISHTQNARLKERKLASSVDSLFLARTQRFPSVKEPGGI